MRAAGHQPLIGVLRAAGRERGEPGVDAVVPVRPGSHHVRRLARQPRAAVSDGGRVRGLRHRRRPPTPAALHGVRPRADAASSDGRCGQGRLSAETGCRPEPPRAGPIRPGCEVEPFCGTRRSTPPTGAPNKPSGPPSSPVRCAAATAPARAPTPSRSSPALYAPRANATSTCLRCSPRCCAPPTPSSPTYSAFRRPPRERQPRNDRADARPRPAAHRRVG